MLSECALRERKRAGNFWGLSTNGHELDALPYLAHHNCQRLYKQLLSLQHHLLYQTCNTIANPSSTLNATEYGGVSAAGQGPSQIGAKF